MCVFKASGDGPGEIYW